MSGGEERKGVIGWIGCGMLGEFWEAVCSCLVLVVVEVSPALDRWKETEDPAERVLSRCGRSLQGLSLRRLGPTNQDAENAE
jgi:hypothetical protein